MVVRMRHNKSQRNGVRSHHALKKQKFLNCPKCGKPTLAHAACSFCGYYNNNMAVDVMAIMEKKEKKRKEKQAASE